MYIKDIAHQIPDVRKNKEIATVDWQEYAPMCMVDVNSQFRRYGGYTPGRRVVGKAPKLLTGAVCNTHFRNFTNRSEYPVTQTRDVLVKFRGGKGLFRNRPTRGI